MARKPRIQFEGALYHVTTRGNRRELIVKDEMDYAMLQKMLIEAMMWTGICLLSWCLMPNHVHVLVETPDANLAVFMQRWLTRYAHYFNWRHGLVGHVFQGRYDARLCQEEVYFKQLIRYIHLNPYKVKTRGFVGPQGWKWSSHRYSMGEPAPEGCRASIERALLHFSDDLPRARKAYATFLADGLKNGNWEDFYTERTGEFLGDKEFIARHQKQAEARGKEQKTAPAKTCTLDDILEAVQEHLHVSLGELSGPSQKRALSHARQVAVYVARTFTRIPVTELAEALARDISAISQMMRRSQIAFHESPEVRILIEALGFSREGLQLSNCQA